MRAVRFRDTHWVDLKCEFKGTRQSSLRDSAIDAGWSYVVNGSFRPDSTRRQIGSYELSSRTRLIDDDERTGPLDNGRCLFVLISLFNLCLYPTIACHGPTHRVRTIWVRGFLTTDIVWPFLQSLQEYINQLLCEHCVLDLTADTHPHSIRPGNNSCNNISCPAYPTPSVYSLLAQRQG